MYLTYLLYLHTIHLLLINNDKKLFPSILRSAMIPFNKISIHSIRKIIPNSLTKTRIIFKCMYIFTYYFFFKHIIIISSYK